MTETEKELLDRFVRYVKVWTTSDPEKADAGVIPSTENQRDLAAMLKEELTAIGAQDVMVTDHNYVCARIPASAGYESAPCVGFLAHMDTASDVSGLNVQPQIYENYDGSVIQLKDGFTLDPEKDTCLKMAVGETVISSDGTTLLGADDKAGIAEIMTAAAEIISHPEIKHGPIEIIFSPDEETGHGMDFVPLDWMQSKQCYTFDGGHIGEVECECFTAWKSEIEFTGISKHPGSARPDFVNAVTMASAFVNLLPQNEAPEATDGYLGFYAPMGISGEVEKANVALIVRDFTMENMQRRLAAIDAFAAAIEAKFPGGKVKVTHTKQYLNMKEKLDEAPEVLDKLVSAVKSVGVEPVFAPIRGGTDGSRLTEMGIPTPNMYTGGHNFHSRFEWCSLNQMYSAEKVIVALVSLWAEK